MKVSSSLLSVTVLFASFSGLQAQCVQHVSVFSAPVQSFTVVETVVCDETAELLARVERMVEPMSSKVALCHAEQQASEEAVQHRQTELAGAEDRLKHTYRKLQLVKRTLCQPGCMVRLGNCEYRREDVAAVMKAELARYQSQSDEVSVRQAALAQAVATAEEVAAKAARWRAAEAELLAQFEQLQSNHEQRFGGATSDLGNAERITGQLEAMLEGAAESQSTLGGANDTSGDKLSAAEMAGVVEQIDDLLQGSTTDR